MTSLANYPLSSQTSLASQFVGKTLADLPTPAIVLDRALIKKNCDAMLNVCKELGVGFRAHVKSHKTVELSKLQVGEGKGAGPANFIVSTIIEAENLLPCLLEEQAKGREGSVSSLSSHVLVARWPCAVISLLAELSCHHSLLTIFHE